MGRPYKVIPLAQRKGSGRALIAPEEEPRRQFTITVSESDYLELRRHKARTRQSLSAVGRHALKEWLIRQRVIAAEKHKTEKPLIFKQPKRAVR